MALSMTINGNTRTVKAGTLQIKGNINARSTARAEIQGDANDIEAGQVVYIYDGASKIFGGTIESFTLTYYRGVNGQADRRFYRINCVDFNQRCDTRRVALAYESETVSTIVNGIVSEALDGEGITVGTLAKGTTVIDRAVFKRIPVSSAFDYIKDLLGLNWNIDYDKELTFFKRDDVIGTAYTDANCYSMTLEASRQKYRNRQYARGGDATTETQVDEPPSPAPDGVSRVFTVRLPLASKPTIKLDTGSGYVAVSDGDVGILGLDTGKKWYWNKNSKQVVQDASETVLAVGDGVTVSYQGLKEIIVQVDNIAGQATRQATEGGSGIYEDLINIKSLDSQQAVQDYARGLLQRYGTIPRTVTVQAEEGRQPGLLVRVNSTNLDVNMDMLVIASTITDRGNDFISYEVVLASGEDVGGWVDFFRSLKQGEELNIQGDEILVLLKEFEENMAYTGEVTLNIFDVLVPSDTLYPSDTQYPNGTATQVVLND